LADAGQVLVNGDNYDAAAATAALLIMTRDSSFEGESRAFQCHLPVSYRRLLIYCTGNGCALATRLFTSLMSKVKR